MSTKPHAARSHAARAWSELTEIATDCASLATIQRVVQNASHELRFTTNAKAALEWPQLYFDDVYSFQADGVVKGASINVTVSRELHDRARATLEQLSDGEPSSTYEDQLAHRWRVPGWTVIAYAERPGVILVDRELPAVSFVTTPEDLKAPFEAARLIREVFSKMLEHDGWFVMHAGAVDLGGRGLIVCGPKFAGKTTLVCALIEWSGAHFIANDRINVSTGSSGFRVLAWPMSSRIGIGTCLASPALRPWLQGGDFAYPQTGWDPRTGLTDGDAERLARSSAAPKIELVTKELVGALGGAATAGGEAICIIFPRWRRDGPPAEIHVPESGEDVVERLCAQLLTPHDSDYPDWLELRRCDETELATAGRQLLRAMAAQLTVFEVSFADASAAATTIAKALHGSN
jgi:hypothetical protein